MRENKTQEKKPKLTSAGLIVNAEFQFKTFDEANILADYFSRVSPNPILVRMGLFELFTNAIEHGNLNISSDEKMNLQKESRWLEEIERRLALAENQHKYVDVLVTRQDNTLEIQITDQGNGFDWKKYEADNKTLNLDVHGRGIVMAKELAFKKLLYSDRGNSVTAILDLS